MSYRTKVVNEEVCHRGTCPNSECLAAKLLRTWQDPIALTTKNSKGLRPLSGAKSCLQMSPSCVPGIYSIRNTEECQHSQAILTRRRDISCHEVYQEAPGLLLGSAGERRLSGCHLTLWHTSVDVLYDPFPLHDLDLSWNLFPTSYDLAHVAEWDPYNLRDLVHVSRVGNRTMHILRNLSQRQVRN